MFRQLVVGWGRTPPADQAAFLKSLGLSDEAVGWISNYPNVHGDLFAQWGIDPTARGMAWDLHDNAWFMVPGGTHRIRSRTGGRQGCKLGATMFNSAYTIGLDLLHARLDEKHIQLRVRRAKEAFWVKTSTHPDVPL